MMPEETARVLRVDGEYAVVKRERSSTCALCPEPEECEEGRGACSIEIRALNRVGAAVGDLVRVRLEGGQLLAAIFLVYGIPIVFMGSGLVVGITLATSAGWSLLLVQALGAAGMLFALMASLFFSRRLDRALDRRGVFTPVIEEVREEGFEV